MSADYRRDEFLISTDLARLDLDVIHGFLTRAYWSEGIPRAVVEQALKHSLSFGLYAGTQQIGLARVITDYATFAYVADVFVLEDYRGRGLGKWLMQTVRAHPELQGLRRWSLATRDAHGLYRQVGFDSLRNPDRWMEMVDWDIYKR
jgi:GNAT superfamily N-acetyltransferase